MNINKIVITGRLYKELEAALKYKTSKEILCLPENEVTEEVLKWADAYVAFRPVSSFDFYNIKWVHSLGAGVDGYLFKRQWKKDVLLTRTICSFGRKISEYCLSHILSELQQHESFKNNNKLSSWQYIEPRSIKQQNIMILGTGVIGQELARNLSLLGANAIGVSASGSQKENFSKVIRFNEIDEYLPRINWLINTLPLTEKTENIINRDVFCKMNNASFINVGRGGSVDEEALICALDNGNLKSAVLDVFKTEPLPVDSKLWRHEKIYITPHISAITSVEEGVKCFLDTLRKVEGKEFDLINKVEVERGY